MTDSPLFENSAGAHGAPRTPSSVDDLVAELRYMIESARPLPLSASSTINKDEVLALVDEIQGSMPDELRSARWLLKERDEFRAKMRREGDEIVALARNRAEQMVQRTQVVKAAEARARKVLEAAEAEARRLRLEAEDYCDQKLGSFENVLQKTLSQVGAGRAKLQGNLLDELGNPAEQVHPLDEPTVEAPHAQAYADPRQMEPQQMQPRGMQPPPPHPEARPTSRQHPEAQGY